MRESSRCRIVLCRPDHFLRDLDEVLHVARHVCLMAVSDAHHVRNGFFLYREYVYIRREYDGKYGIRTKHYSIRGTDKLHAKDGAFDFVTYDWKFLQSLECVAFCSALLAG